MSDPGDQLFLKVYREHAGLVIKTAHAFTTNAADRDDLYQEILLSVWQALPQFKGQAKLSTYVYRVAHSCALNWKRSRQRYQGKIDRFVLEVPDLTASTEERERVAWLYARIQQLSPVDRTLILLYLDKINYADMAEITGLSETNIGVRLHRIKQQLTALSEKIPHEI
jgi:RNA polymerase sigma-70 factor (ECF subfamily)